MLMFRRMSETTFTLTYDGPSLADHTMDVADLAPALVALSQFMKSAARLSQGDDFQVVVRAKALETGCFQIVLDVSGTFASQVVDLLAGRTSTAIANLLGITGGALGLITWIAGRKVRRLRPSRKGYTVIELEDGTELEVAEAEARVALDPPARAALEKVIEPLEKDGIDTVMFKMPSGTVTVTEADIDSFKAVVHKGDEILETTAPMVFSIVSLSFQPGNKWRLSTGKGAPVSVTVDDEDFIDRVQRSEIAFAKGDFLICLVRTTSRESAGKLVTDYTIVKVQEHRRITQAPKLIDS